MIHKEDLKDYLAESERKEHEKKLEEFIDKAIKRNALAGNTTFHISTGEYTQDGSRKTPFYDIWNTKGLSMENRRIVQTRIISKYRENGFEVVETSIDCGWHNQYEALKFNNIDKLVTDE
ncbi:hypothetical protein [Salibacterium lacus]|uniref:Uncharacterized protein n=1 Tax=Salibacterium lacus TaxID=1898109 RepID=A0ABW5SWP7_9BACI